MPTVNSAGRQAGEVGVERGDRRVAALLGADARQVLLAEPVDDRTREDEVAVAPRARAGRAREVEGAEDEVRRREARRAAGRAQAQQRQRREVPARRLAADREAVRGAELRRAAVEQPQGGVLAVVGPRRVGMLGREAVLDARGDQACRVGELHEAHVLLVGGAQRPAAAVDVQEGAGDLPVARRDDPQAHRAVAPVDLDPAGVVGVFRLGEDAAPLRAGLAHGADRHLPRHRQRPRALLEVGVEGAGLVRGGGGHAQ